MGTLLAALGLNVTSQFYKKWFLGKSRISLPAFIVSTSLVLWVLSALVIPFWSLDVSAALKPASLTKLLVVIIASLIFPWLYYGSLRKEKLGRFEAMMTLEPLLTMTVAAVLLPAERDPRVWLAGVVSVGALVWAHSMQHRIRFDRYERTLVMLMCISALEAVLIRQLLDIYSPITFYTLRILLLAPLLVAIHGWHWPSVTGSLGRGVIASAVLSFATVPVTYFAYQTIGVSLTSLVIGVLSPISLYLLGQGVLHEQTRPRVAIAGFVVLLCAVYAAGWGPS